MHAFSLTVGSLLGDPWAKELVKRAQRLVSYMQASNRAYYKLLDGAKSLGIKGQTAELQQYTLHFHPDDAGVCCRAGGCFGYLLNNHGSVVHAADIAPIIRAGCFGPVQKS